MVGMLVIGVSEMDFPLFNRFLEMHALAKTRWPAHQGGPLTFSGFDAIGLSYIRNPPKREEYYCDPINSAAFAGTGGGGTHFAFVTQDEAFHAASPVIVTTPDGGSNNVIGENFYDFLCLGCTHGYFMLEGICQSRIRHEYLMEPHPWDQFRDEQDESRYVLQQEMLSWLRAELQLHPWRPDVNRFAELNKEYRHLLRFRPEQREYLACEYEYPPSMFLD